MIKKAIILINTGTPDNPEKKYVRKFLSEFLNDRRVIDIPWIFRKILVNFLIIPFRTSKSALLYRKLWTDEGSPLLLNLENLIIKLSERKGESISVIGAVQYGNPSLKKLLRDLEKESISEIVIFPLFPQYSSSTTGSVNEIVMNELKSWNLIPKITFTNYYYSNPYFIEAWVTQIRKYNPDSFDHVLFSYHGLPVKHIQKSHPEIGYMECTCENEMPAHGILCYRAACYETTRLITEKLKLEKGKYSTSFQSRLSKNWIKPFTDNTLLNLADRGKKKVLVIAPSFVSDCLETIVEINDIYKSLFLRSGGKELVLAESLNANDDWVNAIIEIAGI